MRGATRRALMALALPAATATAQGLNDTGVQVCVDAAGRFTTACAGTGHDAGQGRDVTDPGDADGLAGFSFVRVCHSGERAGQGRCPAVPVLGRSRNQWGCTLDTVTGLMWELKTSDGGPRDRNRAYTNHLPGHPQHGSAGDAAGYVAAVNATGLCGARDWQLPTRLQLSSIVHLAGPRGGPMLDAAFFPNTTSWYHWTSTARGQDGAEAVSVAFDRANMLGGARSLVYSVRLVRATQPLPAPRWRVSADGQEVTDAWTRLVWRRCVEGMSWNGEACVGAPATADWLAAVASAPLAAPGWRVPNVKELASLVDDGASGARVDPVVFPQTPAERFWTSTVSPNDQDYAWSLDFASGDTRIVSQRNWDGRSRVRLVRDAAP